jgi:hypothetical protein
MDKPVSLTTAMLAGIAFGLAPDRPIHGDPAGHECQECRLKLGHAEACTVNALTRFVQHCRDHPPCRKSLGAMAEAERYDGSGLCPRARKLFDRARALGEARDAEYERTMGGRPGESRESAERKAGG